MRGIAGYAEKCRGIRPLPSDLDARQ
jgi:hypothetical protein